ncbi:MAG TPA: type II secretion system F family protein [Acidimicrobiales bacterium]|nr:type II secretion system F family protein [Acidimicrobiales bacterium]HWH34159.1 type II secretion system F family protein [Acidimicrobiales bacterium]
MTAALAAAWAGLVLVAARRWGPSPARPRARALNPGEAPPAEPPGRRLSRAVGGLALRLARRPADPAAAARLGRAVLVAAAVTTVAGPLGPALGAVVWAWPALGARRRRRREHGALLRHLPEVADLLVLAVGAGLTVPLAVAALARRAPGPLAGAFGHAHEQAALGRRLADALDDIPARLGDDVRPLVAALVASDRYGAPLLDGLVRLSCELRADRRRRAEEAARRVPVKMLFPLVFCTLPAFALLTVAPLLAGAFRSLRL